MSFRVVSPKPITIHFVGRKRRHERLCKKKKVQTVVHQNNRSRFVCLNVCLFVCFYTPGQSVDVQSPVKTLYVTSSQRSTPRQIQTIFQGVYTQNRCTESRCKRKRDRILNILRFLNNPKTPSNYVFIRVMVKRPMTRMYLLGGRLLKIKGNKVVVFIHINGTYKSTRDKILCV